jgi:hypothetical protein
MLLPRPEIKMTMRFVPISHYQCLCLAGTPVSNFPNAENRFSFALERPHGVGSILLRNNHRHADATIEHAMHFSIG